MDKLIEALQIFLKYQNNRWPTHCEHDIMMISDITKEEISEEDSIKLKELDFHWNEEYDCWTSYHYGSA